MITLCLLLFVIHGSAVFVQSFRNSVWLQAHAQSICNIDNLEKISSLLSHTDFFICLKLYLRFNNPSKPWCLNHPAQKITRRSQPPWNMSCDVILESLRNNLPLNDARNRLTCCDLFYLWRTERTILENDTTNYKPQIWHVQVHCAWRCFRQYKLGDESRLSLLLVVWTFWSHHCRNMFVIGQEVIVKICLGVFVHLWVSQTDVFGSRALSNTFLKRRAHLKITQRWSSSTFKNRFLKTRILVLTVMDQAFTNH